ncbi:NAD-dependent epimerase/dehydratase family protein [Candidatus Ferrigenium straubiae]|jgi:nucleoside-diphosphate-sugar epimerase|uniref:NAD-dependent epimerase/dehydratase family protein n=1 Tax=Candidatus Ferrigenium straubiae TaxID=2919506 RepID=UPI003F4ACAA8
MTEKLHKVLVTGATGFIGRALCQSLLDSDVWVIAAVRCYRPDSVFTNRTFTQVEVGEISGTTDWMEALDGVEVVFHLAAHVHVMQKISDGVMAEFWRINVAGAEHLARCAAARGVKRLVFVSSIGVNGTQTSANYQFSELDVPAPHDGYAISKWEAEKALYRVMQETGLEIVIIRPPLVYGGGAPGNFGLMIKALGLPLPLASINNLRDFIYVGNLVSAMLVCAKHSDAAGKTYLVRDGEAISTPNLLRQLGREMGCTPWLIRFPIKLLKILGKLTGYSGQIERLSSSLRLNDDKIRHDLEWVPPYTLEQGLRATAEWYRVELHPKLTQFRQ